MLKPAAMKWKPLATRQWRMLLAMALLGSTIQAAEYRVLEPEKSKFLHESAHFVARWDDANAVKLDPSVLIHGLETLERIRTFYLDKVGFPPPYSGQADKYKININLSDQGWASGSGTGKNDPAMWLHYRAFQDAETLAHEFAHCMQFSAMGMRDSPFVGWSWESHAEWMTHQMYPHQVGCSHQLVDAPHVYYGSTRNRYGNWQFWEFIKDRYGYKAINDIWTKSRKPGEDGQDKEDPIAVLARNQGWDTATLGDHFGKWAMHNVTWDYKNGAVLRAAYGSYDDRSGSKRHRVTRLNPIDATKGRYQVPAYWAPQRYGYNLVRINPDISPDTGNASLSIRFHGHVQNAPAITKHSGAFENEPSSIDQPASDWRWGLVAVTASGTPRYSRLQRGASASLTFALEKNEVAVWLVVLAAPSTHHSIFWDQMYYTLYRYPWSVEIRGGKPEGSGPAAPQTGRVGKLHANGGGWVDDSARVDPSVYVAPGAMVLERAVVSGQARIEDFALVTADARVSDKAVVRGRAMVAGQAVVADSAVVADDATIYNGNIRGHAKVEAMTIVDGTNTKIRDHVRIAAVMNTVQNCDLHGTVQLLGDLELTEAPSQGVFYGIVEKHMLKDPRWGADRSAPEPEVTAAIP